MGYSPQGCKELDTTERLHFTSLHCRLPVPYQLVPYVSRIWKASRWMKEAEGIIPRIMEILSSMVLFFFLNMSSLFIYLAVPGLSCNMQNLPAFEVATFELLFVTCGIWFPD